MTQWQPPRYRDYLKRPPEPVPERVPDPYFAEFTVVMKLRDGSWNAVQHGEMSALGEFVGTKEDAIAWARHQPGRCLVYSEESGDVEPLDDD